MRRISDSLYTSKIRYGIQLYGRVRMNNTDPTDTLLDSLQTTQNKFARFTHGSTLLDRIEECKTLSAVKTQIKIYIRTLPI